VKIQNYDLCKHEFDDKDKGQLYRECILCKKGIMFYYKEFETRVLHLRLIKIPDKQ
jgi:hypothetical protein